MKTWQGEQWKIGGGAGWSWISYDPELDLIYYGTANPGPWNAEQRPGDNKWTCTLFARRPDTGEAIWAYQINPHDDHDYDGVNENILLDLNIKAGLRKVLAHPDRNARMYIIDRATGEVISAEPFAHQNTSEGGRPENRAASNTVDAKKPPASKPCATSARRRRAAKTGSPPRSRHDRPDVYSAQQSLHGICKACRPTTLRARRMSARTSGCIAGPGGNRGEFTRVGSGERPKPFGK